MELFDLYDCDRKNTGKTLERGLPVPKGLYRMVVHMCIFNSEGKMLIQQRQPFKHSWSGMWDLTVGGSSVAGDTSISAVIRETYEEIGVTLAADEPKRILTVQTEHIFDDIYTLKKDLDISALKLQTEEVAQVRWADMGEIKKMIHDETFIPYHESLIELLFFMKDQSGDDGTRTARDKTER